MKHLRFGFITAPIVGALWMPIVVTTVSIAASFITGDPYRPSSLFSLIFWGGLIGAVLARFKFNDMILAVIALILTGATVAGLGPMVIEKGISIASILASVVMAASFVWSQQRYVSGMPWASLTRHEFEEVVIRFLTGAGYVFFTAIVLIPFFVMVMTSLKSQQALLANPLDFSLDLSKGMDLFRSYSELITDFNFGSYLYVSTIVSIATVLITLLFSIPGAYAVARLRFKGQAAFSRSILLIYMVPMIVLALPIYIAFSITGLRNSITGIVLIYPVTTIPVALYMLQGYFRGLPSEVEDAGLMDGLSRLAVIWKITLPLSLPALASVSLYVFMIAWNEFLLAFMLLDDPSKFTLTRGIASLNSSEIPRQHLMAGAVIATVPIMAIFLGLERFMTKGLTAGSVKG